MSVVPKTMRSIRIIALPLTRSGILGGNRTPANKTRVPNPTLTYYHFQLTSPSALNTANEQDNGIQGRIRNVIKWASTKAADGWAGFAKAPEGSWKLRTYQYGERIVDRMDFEELALKGIDPSLGPSLTHPDLGGHGGEKMCKEADESKGPGKTLITIPLLYPPFAYPSATPTTTPHPALLQLQSLLANRTPRHRKGFFTWMIIAPFTIPFMIVPIIPNLPFFFCVWRSWSHYRAYRASQYLEALIDHGAIVPKASEDLDKLYTEYDPSKAESTSLPLPSSTGNTKSDANISPPTSDPDLDSKPELSNLLLTRAAIPAILSLFNLTGSSSADLYRALEQARLRSGNVTSK